MISQEPENQAQKFVGRFIAVVFMSLIFSALVGFCSAVGVVVYRWAMGFMG